MQGEITEIKAALGTITQALLGSYEKGGVIEETRNLRQVVDNQALTLIEHEKLIKENNTQLNDVVAFKKEIKRIVGWIAILIPIAFEFLKFAGEWFLESFLPHK